MSAVGPVSRTWFDERELGEGRVRLEGRGEERVAGHEAHDEVRRAARTGASTPSDASFWTWVRTWFACVRSSLGPRSRRRCASIASRYADSGTLESTTTSAPSGRCTTRSGRWSASSSVRIVQLLVEVAVLDHAGHLDDLAQLQLAPSAAGLGAAQRGDEVLRLDGQLLLGAAKRVDLRA